MGLNGDIIGIFYKKGLKKIWSTAVFSRKWSVHGEFSWIFHIYVAFEGSIFRFFIIQRGNGQSPDYALPSQKKPEGRARWWGPLDWKSKKHLRSTLRFFSVSNKNQPSSWNEMLFFRYSFTMFHSFCVYLTYSFHMLLARWFSWPVFLQTRPGQANHRTGMYSSCHP